jgi:hypothetical protein
MSEQNRKETPAPETGATPTGYAHPGYAASLAEFGTPRHLPRSGSWILERETPGLAASDAMGCYPLFCCQDWSQLHLDLQTLDRELVSLAVVTDPFGDYRLADLKRCFPNLVIPFKNHVVIDLHRPPDQVVSRHHRKRVRHALRGVQVEPCPQPSLCIDEWMALYDTLIARHQISGLQAFSRESFSKQLSIPGTIMLRAVHDGDTVGAHIYFVQGDVVYAHLGAASQAGYGLGALYALDWCSIDYFAPRARYLDLGAGAGINSDGTDGLTRYKRGWSSETRTAYFCGRIFDPQKYAQLVELNHVGATSYFPAYRHGEFG